MAKARRSRPDPFTKRANETWLEHHSRIAALSDEAASRKQSLVTPEAASHGDYEDGYTEVDGRRASVKINRGGSTIVRWMNQPPDDALGDSERAAIRYCQSLWARLDYHSPCLVVVDCGRDGMSEHEALGELSSLKTRLPPRYWNTFENICRFEIASARRDDKVVVAFTAGMIAMWRGL